MSTIVDFSSHSLFCLFKSAIIFIGDTYRL
nr:MAG TPA: hypothetical protein [Caudoviricetes sp.]